jgi:hypothetical protein
VKEIALTDRGIEAAGRIGSTMSSAPEEFQALTRADRRSLAELMKKVVPVDGSIDPFRSPTRS